MNAEKNEKKQKSRCFFFQQTSKPQQPLKLWQEVKRWEFGCVCVCARNCHRRLEWTYSGAQDGPWFGQTKTNHKRNELLFNCLIVFSTSNTVHRWWEKKEGEEMNDWWALRKRIQAGAGWRGCVTLKIVRWACALQRGGGIYFNEASRSGLQSRRPKGEIRDLKRPGPFFLLWYPHHRVFIWVSYRCLLLLLLLMFVLVEDDLGEGFCAMERGWSTNVHLDLHCE